MEYQSQKLLKEFCRAVFNQIKKAKIDWQKADDLLQTQYASKGVQHHTHIFTLCKKAELGDQFAIAFLSFVNDLVIESEILVPFKKKFREMIQGKINNPDDWNYLNPIGELAVLKKLLDSGFTLIAIENQTRYPELTPKDLLVKNNTGQEWLIEILNIHLDDKDYADLNALKAKFQEKISGKITKETSGLLPGNSTPLMFLPVIWYADLFALKAYQDYFTEFANSFGKSDGYSFRVLGYCAFAKVGTKFHFGAITSFFDEERYSLTNPNLI